MKLTGELLEGFTATLLMKNFDNPVASPEFHRELWDLMCLDDEKVAVAAPRGFAKSTAVTHCYSIANLMFCIKDHILIVSDTEGQAASFLGDIRNELEENEELRQLFHFESFIKDKETECIGKFTNGKQFRIIAKGSEQKLRGLKWRGKRPNLIICDDIENDEIVLNDVRREKFRRWFYNALLPAGSRHSHVRVVGTILHMDSILERLMPPANSPMTIHEPLKDYSKSPRIWKSIRYRAHDEDFSHLLWEEHMSQERLIAIRQDYIEQGFPDGYSQEYLNNPIDESVAFFRKSDFVDIEEDDQPMEFYVAVDLAISEKKSSAYTAFVVAGISPKGVMRIVDVERFRGDALEIVETFFMLVAAYSPECFFVEQENIARALGPVLTKEMQEREVYFNIEGMQASQDKLRRARGIQARMRSGAVEVDMEADWYPSYMQEFLQFPRGTYKDQVDATAWLAIGLDKIVEAQTKEELEEEAYERELEEAYENDYYGASRVTGY